MPLPPLPLPPLPDMPLPEATNLDALNSTGLAVFLESLLPLPAALTVGALDPVGEKVGVPVLDATPGVGLGVLVEIACPLAIAMMERREMRRKVMVLLLAIMMRMFLLYFVFGVCEVVVDLESIQVYETHRHGSIIFQPIVVSGISWCLNLSNVPMLSIREGKRNSHIVRVWLKST